MKEDSRVSKDKCVCLCLTLSEEKSELYHSTSSVPWSVVPVPQ